jgi:hypothetical protein
MVVTSHKRFPIAVPHVSQPLPQLRLYDRTRMACGKPIWIEFNPYRLKFRQIQGVWRPLTEHSIARSKPRSRTQAEATFVRPLGNINAMSRHRTEINQRF